MPLSWNEIKNNALKFSQEWLEETSEKGESQSFWNDFFNIFGVTRRRVATFEQYTKTLEGKGYIDLLWKGVLLIEHKSKGKDLDKAYSQAKDYFSGLKENDLPRYILVSDFTRFRLYDLEENNQNEFSLKELYQNIHLFGFIAGYQTTSYKESDPVNIVAAERMGKLHDKLKSIGYYGHSLEVYLVRLLFCLFADNTSIFERYQFRDLIVQRTHEDGQDLAHWLGHLFEILDTPPERRLTNLDEQLASFPYINGSLFQERLPLASFDREMRETLLHCCSLDWSRISPAIFGSLFQSVMDSDKRRNLGAHYTSEKNILKLIKPLFLDELREEFERVKNSTKRLTEFHQKLSKLRFFDPACGCGNFLVIAYRELRELELDVLQVIYKNNQMASLDVKQFNILCDVDQFYGVEIEEFPAQIAQTALWLTDHQMNLKVSEQFGNYFVRLPLKKSATIVHGNALKLDWTSIINPQEMSYILGNPPFVGYHLRTASQKEEMESIFHDVKGAGVLDYVTAWYRKAVDYMKFNDTIKTAFVSTNSITQGEQVSILWADFVQKGVKINFAHRTFQWSNEARGNAGVYCVIIGFGLKESSFKRLFDYETPKSEAREILVSNINPYLIDFPDLFIIKRTMPICNVESMTKGNQPTDGGFLLLTDEEKLEFLEKEPNAKPYIKPFISAKEFLNKQKRWCLWLVDISPRELKSLPLVLERVEQVKQFRLKSSKVATQKQANIPYLFSEIRQPNSEYLLIPRVSSENRRYIPIGFFSKDCIISDTCSCLPNASLYSFGVMSSAMHMTWMRYICGRLKSDYRYSNTIVYNNFPFPKKVTPKQVQKVEDCAIMVLETREQYPESSLADLYDPLTMPSGLLKAHEKLDQAVDQCYGRLKFNSEFDRITFLFQQYQELTNPLGVDTGLNPIKKRRSRKK